MPSAAQHLSVAEYLAADEASEGKLEYLGGLVVAMAGASIRHNLIVSNIARILGNALAGRPCYVLTQDQRVCVSATQSYLYPDVVVVCDEVDLTDERPQSLRNPCVVVEVLSASTQGRDQGAKLGHYRRIPSVAQVLLIAVDEPRATVVERLDEESWKLRDVGPGTVVEVTGLGITIDLADVYDKVDDLPA